MSPFSHPMIPSQSAHSGSLHSLLPFVLYCLHGYFSIFPCWPPMPYSLYWKHWSTLLHPLKSQKWQFLLLNYAGLTFVLILVPDQHQPRGRIFFFWKYGDIWFLNPQGTCHVTEMDVSSVKMNNFLVLFFLPLILVISFESKGKMMEVQTRLAQSKGNL